MERFKLNRIKPLGWFKEVMKKDLNGFVGELDNIVPDIIKDDDIYGTNRLSKEIKNKDVGNIAQDADWKIQYLWWNSETQSNWLDGLIRDSFYLNDEAKIKKAEYYINRVLNSQDEDGYIGIYDKNLRFNFDSENGELWAQSTFFRAALAYYEFTNDETVKARIEKAFDVIMNAYQINNSTPFKTKSNYAGLCHGLTIVDACYTMYKYTKDNKYLNFAKWLYDNYSLNVVSEPDAQACNLSNYEYRLKGHGVHTYEHIRAVIIANLATKGKYQSYIDAYFNKINFCLTPSGGPIGDEWVAKRIADATNTGYEYCSIHELLDSYEMMLETTGELHWADKIEWLLFNAGFGARHPKQSQIAYCKTDNSYLMDGDTVKHITGKNIRYKYSAAHQDAAVCCVPNAGRILPYFMKNVYMRKDNGLQVALYAPSEVSFNNEGTNVKIVQETNYPFDLNVKINITAESRTKFPLYLRKPSWADDVVVKCEDALLKTNDDVISVIKEWQNDDIVSIEFKASVKQHSDLKGDVYFSYGTLLYSLPIKATEAKGKCYINKYYDTKYTAVNDYYKYMYVVKDTLKSFEFINRGADFSNPPILSGKLFNKSKDTNEEVELTPIGSNILRRVTFKQK